MSDLGHSAEPETSSESCGVEAKSWWSSWKQADWWESWKQADWWESWEQADWRTNRWESEEQAEWRTNWWQSEESADWRTNWRESGEQADWRANWWESEEKADWQNTWWESAEPETSSLETENWWQHISKALRRWLSERPHMQKYVDVDGLEVPPPGDCVRFPLRGMWPAEPGLDKSPFGNWHDGNGIVVYHGCAVTRLQSILSSTRLVRGHRSVAGKHGPCAAAELGTALKYAPPACLSAFAGEQPVQCAFQIRALRSLRVKQLAGKQYVLRENWCELEALIITPWDREFPHRQKDFHTKPDKSELPPNEPVQNWPFFNTWALAPLEFTRALEEQRLQQGIVLEC